MRAGRETRQEIRREAILEAALAVVAERGLAETRMSDISERASMSSGHVLYYFKTKEALLMEALRFVEDRFHDAADADLAELPAGPARLRRLLELDLPAGRGDPRWALWLEAWTLAAHDEEVATLILDLETRWAGRLSQVVRDGVGARAFVCEDVDGFVLGFSALFDGLAIRVVAATTAPSKEVALRMCMRAAARELSFELD
ncbi:MAG: TetR/AcrR family transcriptional regulator, partial [Actinomycetota bacterium]